MSPLFSGVAFSTGECVPKVGRRQGGIMWPGSTWWPALLADNQMHPSFPEHINRLLFPASLALNLATHLNSRQWNVITTDVC